MYYTLHIPVSRFQLKILNNKLGEKWRLKTSDWLGRILVGALRKSSHIPKKRPDSGLYYSIEIPYAFIQNKGLNHIDECGVRQFVQTVEKQFKNELFVFVDSRLTVRVDIQPGHIEEYGLTIKDSILDFCLEYGLTEEEIPYDTLKKAYYRHRNSSESGVVLNAKFYSTKMSRE